MSNPRRFFAIRAAQAKKARTSITICGRTIEITDGNREMVDHLIQRDAEAAYAAAALKQPYVSRIAV